MLIMLCFGVLLCHDIFYRKFLKFKNDSYLVLIWHTTSQFYWEVLILGKKYFRLLQQTVVTFLFYLSGVPMFWMIYCQSEIIFFFLTSRSLSSRGIQKDSILLWLFFLLKEKWNMYYFLIGNWGHYILNPSWPTSSEPVMWTLPDWATLIFKLIHLCNKMVIGYSYLMPYYLIPFSLWNCNSHNFIALTTICFGT